MSVARILVVEDNEADVFLLRDLLKEQEKEAEIEILSDGEQALHFIREYRIGGREPETCVIVLDLNLRRHDGISILVAIREEPALEHIHVVVLTGLTTPRQEAEIAGLGAIYRRKSTLLEDLVALAAEIIAICKNSPVAPALSPV